MEYFKIWETDFSHYVNELKIATKTNYNAQTNAAGDTVVDKINSKKEIEVGIIPLNEVDAQALLDAIDSFNVSIAFRNPKNSMIQRINCIISENDIEYYTIQNDKQMLKAFKLKFTEL